VGAPHGEYLEDPERLGPYMVSLVREHLVEQVVPGAYLWRAQNFADSFLSFVDAKYGSRRKPYRSDWARVHSEKLGGSTVHMEKLHTLGQKLCERGLAKHGKGDQYSPRVKKLKA
jgi:hypothetical protein